MWSLVWKVLIGQHIRVSHDLIDYMAAHSPIIELDSQISGLAIVKFQMRSSVRSRPTIYARAWCQLWCAMYSLTNFLAMLCFFFNNLCHHHKTKTFPEINMKSDGLSMLSSGIAGNMYCTVLELYLWQNYVSKVPNMRYLWCLGRLVISPDI